MHSAVELAEHFRSSCPSSTLDHRVLEARTNTPRSRASGSSGKSVISSTDGCCPCRATVPQMHGLAYNKPMAPRGGVSV